MHGSVWELCLNEFSEDYYSSNSQQGMDLSQTPAKVIEREGNWRVIRGGSVEYTLDYCRSAIRDFIPQAEDLGTEDMPARRGDVGLRLVLVPDASPDFREQTAAENGILKQIQSLSNFPQETAK